MSLTCPDCSVPLPVPPAPACQACGLPLRGPAAGRLYEIDTALAALRAERTAVLAVLRGAPDAGLRALGAPGPTVPVAGPTDTAVRAARSPQTVLLGLGALLLLVASTVFLAVVWLRIGVVGQVVVMAGLTAAAGAGSVQAARRGLGSTAATLAWLAAGLTAVALQAGRGLGLPGLSDLPGTTTVSLAAGVGAVAAAAVARRTGSRTFAAQAVLSSGLVLPPLLGELTGRPSPVLAATGVWALAALALAALRPAALHPAAAGVVRATGGAAGAVVLGGTVLLGAGVVVAAPVSPLEGLRCALVVTSLAAVALAGAVRRRSGALGAVAPSTGATSLVLAHAVGGVLGDRASWVTAAGVLGALAAGALLRRRRPALRWSGVAGATAAGLALARALTEGDWSGVALLAGAVASTAVAVAVQSRDDVRVRTVALPLAFAGAGGALVSALASREATTPSLVVATAVAAAVTVLGAAWYQEEPEEPGLGAVALFGLLAALTGALSLGAPARPCAALLAAGGLLGLGYACLPRRGWVSPLGVLLSSAASWTLLADTGVHQVELYTLPVAALLLVVGLVRRSREPDAPSWATVGPAAAMALLPGAQVAAAAPGSVRLLLTLLAAAGVLGLGVRLHLRALVVVGGLVVGELALVQVGQAALYLPRWLLLAVLGGLLLGAGATYESRVKQARAAGRWVAALR